MPDCKPIYCLSTCISGVRKKKGGCHLGVRCLRFVLNNRTDENQFLEVPSNTCQMIISFKRLSLVLLIMVALSATSAFGQQGGISIGESGGLPDPSAVLDLQSSQKGILFPRMTTAERNSILDPAIGLQIFNTITNCIEVFIPPVWQSVYCGCQPAGTPTALSQVAGSTQITWNWSSVSGASEYRYNAVNDFATSTSNGLNTSFVQTNLQCETSFNLFVWAVNGCYQSTALQLNQSTSFCCPSSPLAVGTSFGGGRVAATDYPGTPCGYLIAASSNVGQFEWGCNGTTIGGTTTSYGSGSTNTNAIVAGCATTTIGAYQCDNYTSGGFSDWFMPSLNELVVLYNNRVAIGNFPTTPVVGYWSSSESGIGNAHRIRFDTGAQSTNFTKDQAFHIRCVRAF